MRPGKIAGSALAAVLMLGSGVAAAAGACGGHCDGNWIAAWGTAQQLLRPERAMPGPAAYPDSVTDQTVRMVARSTVGGAALRVALSNSAGVAPVRIDAAQVARYDKDGAIRPGSGRALSFGGRSWVVLAPGAQIYSDPVTFDVQAQDDLAVSLFLHAASGPVTPHLLGLRTAWLAAGNQVTAVTLQGASEFHSYLWLAGIEVRAASGAATVVAFGDSITDGYATTPGADTPWPSLLARRLAAQRGRPRAVINMGISGNRVLRDGAGSSALARFDRDVLSHPGVRWVLLLEGINDISFGAIPGFGDSEKATAEDIIAGYRQLIVRARLHGLAIIGGTLTPFEGVPTYTEAGERMRQQVNQWIRSSGEFDAVVDFDAVTRDPAAPTRLRSAFDSGDHIHPNDSGNQAMADAIDLRLFR